MGISPEALARRSARRPWTTVGIWILVLAIAFVLVASFWDGALTTQFTFTNTPESQRGVDLMQELRGVPISTNEVIIVQSDRLTVDDDAFEEFAADLYSDIAALGDDIIRKGTFVNYYQLKAAGLPSAQDLVSEDRRTTIMPLIMAGNFDDATDNIDKVIEVLDGANNQQEFEVLITGQAVVGIDFEEASLDGIKTGEAFGVPVALVILVLVFGALVAALVPLALAVVSIIVALGVASLVGQAFALSFFVPQIIFMIGLAVGIDYSLFIVARYREERARGLEKIDAIGRAGATASRAVLFSGMAVVLGLTAMLLVPFNIFIGIGIGTILVVIASVLSAMTLLPAVLSLLGDHVNKLSIPWIGRVQARFDEERAGGFWDRISHGVMRQPLISLLLAGGLLVAAAVPVFGLSTGFAGVSTMSDDFRSKKGFDILDEKFSAGNITPAQIVIEGDINSQSVRNTIESLKDKLATDNAFSPPQPLEENEAGTIALLTVPVAGDSADEEA